MLPMPISPTPMAWTPSSLAWPASSRPTPMASSTSWRVRAGSLARLRVERRIFRFRIAGHRTSALIPTSATTTEFPKYLARADMPVICRVMFTAWLKVTDSGEEETPSAMTPLSAAKTKMRQLSS